MAFEILPMTAEDIAQVAALEDRGGVELFDQRRGTEDAGGKEHPVGGEIIFRGRVPEDAAARAETLCMQAASPVLWERTLRNLENDGVDTFVEVGAGSALTGFVRRTLPDARAFTVNDAASLRQTVRELAACAV